MTGPADAVLAQVAPHLPAGPIVIALSGGADSAVLAWAAAASGCDVRAVTADHALEVSGPLVAAAGAIAARLGIPHAVVNAPAPGDEAALRAARYVALEAAALPGETLATAHTADDQAETVLGNLLRGSGAAGIAGIPRSRGNWVRPLLGVTRAETRAAAEALGLPFADDPDNLDPGRRRVRLRTEVIPLLEERINPAVRDALRRAGDLAAADDDVLSRRADAVPVRFSAGEARLPAAALAALPVAVSSRAVRRALRGLGDAYPGTRRDVEEALGAVAGPSPRPLAGGLLAGREGPWLVIRPAAADLPVPDGEPLPAPGVVRFGGWEITARLLPEPPSPRSLGRRHAVLAAGEAMIVRAALPGETIALRGGTKSVREALREAGVPEHRRAGWPVVVAGDRMAWVAAVRVAGWAEPPREGPCVVLSAMEAER